MPLLPPLVLGAGSGTEFQLFPLFDIVGPFWGPTRNLGARHWMSDINDQLCTRMCMIIVNLMMHVKE
jgi:hypothetical protein